MINFVRIDNVLTKIFFDKAKFFKNAVNASR